MKKILALFAAVVLFTSCKEHFEGTDYSKLNGYWEIEKVIMPDGSKKEYGVNPTIDYFEVKGAAGFRKKTMPQLDGTYRANDFSESFSISKKGAETILHYNTQYAKWDEELIQLDDKELVVRNQHNIEYHYKKPEPFTLK